MKSSGSEVISLNPDLPELIAGIFFLGEFLECHRVHLEGHGNSSAELLGAPKA